MKVALFFLVYGIPSIAIVLHLKMKKDCAKIKYVT